MATVAEFVSPFPPIAGARLVKTRYAEIPAYLTKDGSEIRELMHPQAHGGRHQSLAEATLPAGGRTLLHRHLRTEELYHVTQGAGTMTLGDERFAVAVGDTVLIPPGTAHCIEATAAGPLKILCCCSPAYAHEDTQLLDAGGGAA